MALRVGPASELDITNLADRDASLTLAQASSTFGWAGLRAASGSRS